MIKPRLKSFVQRTEGDRLVLIQDAGISYQLEDDGGSLTALLALLDGTRTTAEIAGELTRQAPSLTAADVAEGIAALDEAGLLEDGAATTSLTPQQQEQYFNNLAFFGTFASLQQSRFTYQERLRRARVTVLGVGGVGSTVLLQLAGLGVGHITVADFDRVERKNVARQLLYTDYDVGRPKLVRAVARAQALNPEAELRAVEARVRGPNDVAELVAGADLLVLTADTPSSLVDWAGEACVAAGIPLITGGVGLAQASYYSVAPGRSGCMACLRLAERDRTGSDWRPEHPDGIHRGISPAGALVASLIGLEALRYLSGFVSPVAAGRHWVVDLATGETRVGLQWPRRPDCPVCGGPPKS